MSTVVTADPTAPEPEDTLFEGDLLDRSLGKIGLGTKSGVANLRAIAIAIAITWAPLLVLSIVGGNLDSFLRDLGVQVRFLLVVPILLAARSFANLRLSRAVRQMTAGDLIPDEEEPRLRKVLEVVRGMRKSRVALGVIIVVAISAAFAMLREQRALGTGSWAIDPAGRITLAGWWYVAVSVVMMQALRASWIWKWIIWAVFLWQLSRLRLCLRIAHPDLCGGLAFLGRMPSAFGAFACTLNVVLAIGWIRTIQSGAATVRDLAPIMITAEILVLLFLFGPLGLLTPVLLGFRRRSLYAYDLLANRYGALFEKRWLGTPAGSDEDLLGSGDIQSLADLSGAYEQVAGGQVVPFRVRQIMSMAVLTALPFLPVVATEVPIVDLLKQIAGVVL